MKIIPVMDLMRGEVVHAVGGRRQEYRPIESQLVDSSTPDAVARAFRDQLKLDSLYLADLDAIAGSEPAWKTYRKLSDLGLQLMVDAGIRDLDTARAVQAAGATSVVVGLETIPGPDLLRELIQQLGDRAIWFSLDLKDGKPLCDSKSWPVDRPEQIAELAIQMGVTRLIVLDLAAVGRGCGIHTEVLCRTLVTRHPNVELVAGGGIRDANDVDRLASLGISGALVATAIHTRQLLG